MRTALFNEILCFKGNCKDALVLQCSFISFGAPRVSKPHKNNDFSLYSGPKGLPKPMKTQISVVFEPQGRIFMVLASHFCHQPNIRTANWTPNVFLVCERYAKSLATETSSWARGAQLWLLSKSNEKAYDFMVLGPQQQKLPSPLQIRRKTKHIQNKSSFCGLGPGTRTEA